MLLLLPLLLLPALPLAAGEPAEAELARRIEALIGQSEADKAFWGIEVYAPARGRVLYSLNAHRYFHPASVTKLFTTAAALALIGPDYRFRTVVGSRSRIDRTGRLLGNLFLVGGGDPDFAGCDLPYAPEKEESACAPTIVLDRLAAQVAQKGVRTVTGDLVVDQTFFSPEPYPPDWTVGDLLWSYGAPIRALSLADNMLTIKVEPGEQVNDRGRLTWEPFTRFYQVQNQVWTVSRGSETQLYVRRDPGSRVLEISGPIALDHKARSFRVAIEEPSEFAGELFREALERHGVRVLGRAQVQYRPAPPFASEPTDVLPLLLAEHLSLPLAEDVKLINKASQNLHAEMLLRLLGRQTPPATPGTERARALLEPPPRRSDASTEAGLEVLRAWLATAGVDSKEVELYDGSGVARANLVTPHAVVELLKYAENQPWAPLFRDSLPVAGVDGTLKDRMKSSPARARLRAKTGTAGDTNALVGRVETLSGELLLFAIFVNHHTLGGARAEELIDQLGAALVELPPTGKNRKTKLETR